LVRRPIIRLLRTRLDAAAELRFALAVRSNMSAQSYSPTTGLVK
jgi:hypothetical protein